MEDWNMLAADCVVISCCCQCLILQFIIFFFVRFPCKLIRKTKEYAKKKLRRRKRRESLMKKGGIFEDGFLGFEQGSVRIQMEELQTGHDCLKEVERVLEEFSQKGEFAFGSYWGRKEGCVAEQEFDFGVVQFELVGIVSSFEFESHQMQSVKNS